MAPENAEATTQEQKPKPKLPLKTIIIILAVFFLEAGTIGFFKFAHNDKVKPSEATDPIAPTEQAPEQQNTAEVVLCPSMMVDNWVSGRARTVVTVEVACKVDNTQSDALATLVTEHATEIKDAVRTLISGAKPEDLRDNDLQVIKREIRVAIEKIVGEGRIREILIPVWQSYSQD